MKDFSPTYKPKVQRYTKVTLFELTFMVKAKMIDKQTSQKKKKAKPKSKAPTNQPFNYPNFFFEHAVKEAI